MRALALALTISLTACAVEPAALPSRTAAAATSSARSPVASIAPASSPPPRPELPRGWDVPSSPRAGEPTWRRTETLPLDIAPLPVIEVDKRLELSIRLPITPQPSDALVGPKATEVKTLGDRVTISGHRFGGILVGVGSMPFYDFTEGGTALRNRAGAAQLAWTSFDAASDGALDVELVAGFYDVARRQGVEAVHLRVHATPIVEGSFYAFRTTCPTCAPGERERLHLVGSGAFGNVDGGARREPAAGALVAYLSLPLDPGTTGGAATFITVHDVAGFARHTGLKLDVPSRLPAGFYTSRAPSDAAPTVVVRVVGT